MGKSVRQARDYGRKKGVGFCVATNGLSWIAFPVNRRDQVSFEDSSCLIFHDLDEILQDDAIEFRDAFARQSIISGSLDKSLLGTDRDQHEQRRLNNIYDRSFSKINRTSIFPHIEREIIAAFNEELLSDNTELLEKCYVHTPERTRFDSRIQMYLAQREQVLRTQPIRPVSTRGQRSIERYLVEITLNTRSVALLTLGLVGSGKTSFLHYTAKITGREMFVYSASRPSAHWIYIDFRDYSESQDARAFMVERIFAYIQEHPFLRDFQRCVQHVYAEEIAALKSGPLAIVSTQEQYLNEQIANILVEQWKKREPYALKVIAYAARNAPVFLVVDNVDQIENTESQSRIFGESTDARTIRQS